jgi:hypothetical protein
MDSTEDDTEISRRQELQLEKPRDQGLSSDGFDDKLDDEEPNNFSAVSPNHLNHNISD